MIISFKEYINQENALVFTEEDYSRFLEEARRNPEKNIRTTSYEAIKPLLKDKDVCISFTELHKLGINPKSTYHTPNGIYSYPLAAAIEHYNLSKDIQNFGIFDMFPFASEGNYAWVFKPKNPKKILRLDYTYTEKDYERDLDKLRVEFEKRRRKGIFGDPFKKFVKECEKNSYTIKIPAGFLWNVVRCASSDWDPKAGNVNTNKWNWYLRKVLGYDGAIDNEGSGIIHEFEPVQAVFFSKNSISVIDVIENKTENYNMDFERINDPSLSREEFIEILKKNEKSVNKEFLLGPGRNFIQRITNKTVVKHLFEWGFFRSVVNGAWSRTNPESPKQLQISARNIDVYLDVLTNNKLKFDLIQDRPDRSLGYPSQKEMIETVKSRIKMLSNEKEKEKLYKKYGKQ